MSEIRISRLSGDKEACRRKRRDVILAVAECYFLEHGYTQTSMSDIAATLGGSKATLWNYFPSKACLFSAVINRISTAYQAPLSQILDLDSNIAITLHGACVSLITKSTSSEAIALNRLIISESCRFPEMSKTFFRLVPSNTRDVMAHFLKGAMARGLLRVADPDVAARSLISLCLAGSHQQMLMSQITIPDPVRIEEDAAFAVDIFLRAYARTNYNRPPILQSIL